MSDDVRPITKRMEGSYGMRVEGTVDGGRSGVLPSSTSSRSTSSLPSNPPTVMAAVSTGTQLSHLELTSSSLLMNAAKLKASDGLLRRQQEQLLDHASKADSGRYVYDLDEGHSKHGPLIDGIEINQEYPPRSPLSHSTATPNRTFSEASSRAADADNDHVYDSTSDESAGYGEGDISLSTHSTISGDLDSNIDDRSLHLPSSIPGAYTHTHTHIHTYIHTYINKYIHTYIHTYILTYSLTYLLTYLLTNLLTSYMHSHSLTSACTHKYS